MNTGMVTVLILPAANVLKLARAKTPTSFAIVIVFVKIKPTTENLLREAYLLQA